MSFGSDLLFCVMAVDGELPPDIAQILRGGLKSRAPTEREIAVRQLSAGCRACRHKQVLAALTAMSQDPDKFVRREIASALGAVSPQGESSVVAVLHLMCDDREWTVRHAAIKSIVLVECGPKMLEGVRSDAWKPAGKRIMDVLTKGIFDARPEIRSASAEAVALAIEDDDPDELLFDMILTAGSNSMAIDKTCAHGEADVSRTPSVESVVHAAVDKAHHENADSMSRKPSIGRVPSTARTASTGPQRTKWASAFERVKSNPKLDRTEAYFSRLGQALHMEGSAILVNPAHPPALLDAEILSQQKALATFAGKIAVFALHPRRMNMAMIYDCAYRAEKQLAAGVVFCIKKPELVAAERYDATEMQKSFQDGHNPAPKRLNIPVICISELMKSVIQDGALVMVLPNTSIVRGLLADDIASVRASALRTLSTVARRNDPQLIDVLVAMIVDPHDDVRRVCVECFSNPKKICPGNPICIHELARITTDENWHVREASLTALCKVANCDRETCDPDGVINNPLAIDAVIERLSDSEGLVKKLAIDGLVTLALADGVIDEEDLPIIETFVESQEDPDPLVSSACTKALAFLSGEDKEVTQVFAWLCDSRPQTRRSSCLTLGNAKHKNSHVVLSLLRKRTRDSYGEVREVACTSLARVASQGYDRCIQILDLLLDDPEAGVRRSAVTALSNVMMSSNNQNEDSETLARLLRMADMVKDADLAVRDAVGDGLEVRARGSTQVSHRLEEILRHHGEFSVRKTALQCIHRISEVGDVDVLQAIGISLRDSRGEVRKLGFQLLKHHYEAGRDSGVDVDSLKESVLECVKDGDPMVVFVTIEAIPKIFDHGNRLGIMALVRCLRHEAPSVREAATRVLGQFAQRGDIRAIGYIVPLMDHHMAYVRYASIIALTNLGVPGDRAVLEPIKKKMDDQEIFVRREAVSALRFLSIRGDETCVSALLSCMSDPDERIRVAAMTGLSAVSNYGDPRVVEAFMKKISLDTRPMRKLSVECLACLITESDYDNLELLMTALEDTEHIVRQAAVQAVVKVVGKTQDDIVIQRVLAKMQHEDRKIRAVVMEVLQGISLPGDQRIVQGMLEALRHPHAQVRKMAVGVISSVAHKGDDIVIGNMAESLADADADVRRAAIDAIKDLADVNSSTAITQIVCQLTNAEWFVRDAAQETLLAITDKGNAIALACLQELLARVEWYARETAIICIKELFPTCSCQILSELGVTCQCSMVEVIIGMTEDPYWKVRIAAMITLQVIASRLDKRIALACRARLKDGDFNVRSTAQTMLRFFE